MANPLARVVMRSIVSKKGIAGKKKSGSSSRSVNLSSKEDGILKNILNRGQKNMTIETLSSLNAKKSVSSSSNDVNISSAAKNDTKGLGTLKTLDALSIGNKSNGSSSASSSKTGYESDYGVKSSAAVKGGGVKAVSIETLVSGKVGASESKVNNTASNRVKPSNDERQQGGMMSLNQLAGNKVNSSSDDNKPQNSERVKTSVRGNVLGNLNDYIPKVTLDSIGKKGSLF